MTVKIKPCPRCGSDDNGRRFIEPLCGGGRGPCQHPVHAQNQAAIIEHLDAAAVMKRQDLIQAEQVRVILKRWLDSPDFSDRQAIRAIGRLVGWDTVKL